MAGNPDETNVTAKAFGENDVFEKSLVETLEKLKREVAELRRVIFGRHAE